MAAISSPAVTVSPREGGFPTELLPSGVHDKSAASRKLLRRETDIPSLDLKQNPSQGRIAGRIVS